VCLGRQSINLECRPQVWQRRHTAPCRVCNFSQNHSTCRKIVLGIKPVSFARDASRNACSLLVECPLLSSDFRESCCVSYPQLLSALPNMKYHDSPFSNFRIIRWQMDRRHGEANGSHFCELLVANQVLFPLSGYWTPGSCYRTRGGGGGAAGNNSEHTCMCGSWVSTNRSRWIFPLGLDTVTCGVFFRSGPPTFHLSVPSVAHRRLSKLNNCDFVRTPDRGVRCASLSLRSFNPPQHSGNYMYHILEHLKPMHSAHTVYLCVLYDSHNKQRLFPQTALTGWALLWRRSVLCELFF
jgi:hypothetical protein